MSRQVGLPHNLRAPRSKPKMASLFFWRPSQDSVMSLMVCSWEQSPGELFLLGLFF